MCYNKQCIECQNACKQSFRAVIVWRPPVRLYPCFHGASGDSKTAGDHGSYQVDRIFSEKISGANKDRPQLRAMLDYVEMFETYGIRSLCKIFCMTDTTSYENLTRHVKFIRHSDLSDGNCCHDEVIEKQRKRN